MRASIGMWLIGIACCGTSGLCAAGCDRSCAKDYSCRPDDWGNFGANSSGDSATGGSGGTGAAGGTGASSDSSGGSDGQGGTAGSGSGFACPEDPIDGVVAEGCGVWVCDAWGDDNSLGTQALPVKTIAKGLDLAFEGTKRVYVCGGLYPEPVILKPGLSLYGGFAANPDTKQWSWAGITQRAIIAPLPGFVALTLLEADGSEDSSHVRDIVARSADAVVPGGSSITVIIQEKTTGEIRRAEIIAGKGADGADGTAGDYNALPAKDGPPGHDGASACSMDPGLGGAAVMALCGNEQSIGASGGDGAEAAATGGQDGIPVPDPNPLDYGLGGQGETAGSACSPGMGGAQGIAGDNGAGAKGQGKITHAGYTGVDGADGKPGTVGQGGGGGGGSLGKPICGAAHGGAGGGSGGAGGCGGRPGKGGQAGGSSIGVITFSMDVSIIDSRITAADAGNGGKGGAMQVGGKGGVPGIGGMSFGGGVDGVKAGCAGGVGGPGGNGGYGGGGHGGHSIASVGAGPVNTPSLVSCYQFFGKAGEGGKGGKDGLTETDGEAGKAAQNNQFVP